MKRGFLVIFLLFTFYSGLFAQTTKNATPLKKVTLQLQWKYSFQFAGFIMAKELGYYRDAGLDVKLLEYNGGDIRQKIKEHKVQYFLQNGALLFDKNNKLMDVKLLATYFQHSPLVLVTQPSIKDISQLRAKTIMMGGNEIYETSLDALLRYYDINPTTAKFVHPTFNLQDFIQKRVDAMSVFKTDQIYELKKRGVAFNTIDPIEYGFVTTANNLFSFNGYVSKHKKEVNAFLDATKKGWEYALADIQKSAKVIYTKYSKRKSLAALIYEGKTTKSLMLQNLYAIGEINGENLTFIYQEYLNRKGLSVNKNDLQNYIYQRSLKSSFLTYAQQKYLLKKKKITICVDPKWKPYEWIDKDGKYRGMGSDYFKLFMKNIPVQTQLYKTENWAESIAAIRAKKCDLLPMAGITKERKKFLSFTAPYYYAPYVVATTTDKSFVENFRDKLRKKYAVIRHSAVLDDLKNLYGNMNIVKVATVGDGLRLVNEGKVFGFINTAKVISYYIQEHNLENIKIDAKLPIGYNLAIATQKNEKMLRNILQSAINSANPVKLNQIQNQWSSVVLESREDYRLFYDIVGVLILVLFALFYRSVILRRANSVLEQKVDEKTVALQRLNAELEQKVEQRTKELKHQAYYDALTNLPNRALFQDRLHVAIEKSKRSGHLVALYFIDLDRFKEINDSLGHQAGDEVLKVVASRLLKNVRKEDTLARLGGDEFTLLVERIKHIPESIFIAQKMLAISKEPIIIQEHTIYISLSVGITLAPQDALNATDLLKNADAAMYKAKEEGRNNFQFYSPQMSKEAYSKILMQTRLRQAIENDEFEVYYQPQVDVVANKVMGFEALMRWNDPKEGVILPDVFMGLAQETGLIVEIDKKMIKEATKQFALWQKEGLCEGRISINLAAQELSNKGYLEFLTQQLAMNELKTQYLEVEITENDIMRNPQEAISKLQEIHALGIRISVDDFGTGYSSLAYLKRFPIDKLKIDQSFILDIPQDDEDCAIVKAVIALGENLGFTLIAEGVETKEQEHFLVQNGCHIIQGFLYAEALSYSDAEKFLKKYKEKIDE